MCYVIFFFRKVMEVGVFFFLRSFIQKKKMDFVLGMNMDLYNYLYVNYS